MDPPQFHQRGLPQAAHMVPAAAGRPKSRNRTWEENYAALLLYKEEHGDCCVPHKYAKDRILAKWCSHLREYYNAGQISQDRISALEAIGFIWNPHEKKWNENYARLVAYWKENGHSKVPTCYKPDPALGKWVSRQREDYSGGYIAENRRKKLDALGFVWRISKNGGRQKRNRPEDNRWEKMYQELLEFHKDHGHSNVPRPDRGGNKLEGWVGVQRCNYSRGLMPQERIDKLKEVGFVFNFNQKKKQEEWNRQYELLRMCNRREGGGFEVGIVGDEASSLSRWIQRQREKYKMYKLEPGREILLKKIDFRFPDRPPKEEKEEEEQSESLKKTLAEIDNSKAEDLFGAEGTKMQQGNTKPDTSMVDAIVDLAGEDKDLGKKVAESIGTLANFMSVTAEELATRMSAPMDKRSTTRNTGVSASQSQDGNAFGTLMPLIVSLREAASESAMKDCVDFLFRMVRKSRAEGARVQPPDDPDNYNKLLTLAVELAQELDKSERSKAVIESCAMYFRHTIEQERGEKPSSSSSPANILVRAGARRASTATVRSPVAKRPRTHTAARKWGDEPAGSRGGTYTVAKEDHNDTTH